MTILLTILKILGIVILAVLGLVLLILLIVLLVPFRLNVKARYEEEVRARVHVSWLLRAVHVKFEWLRDHGLLRAKLLGLKTILRKHVGDWGPEPPEGEAASGMQTEEAPENGSVPAEPGEEPASSDEPASSAEKPADAKEEPASSETQSESGPEPGPKEEKTEEKAEEAPAAKPPEEGEEEELPRMAAIEKKLDEIAGKLDEFQGYWYDEKNRKTLRLIGKQLKKIGRHLKPTHFLMEGELGFGDPAKTGKIMGALYSFYPIFKDHVRINGNYEEQIVRLRLELKGRLRLGIFIGAALRLLLDKNLRSWIKKLTHKDKETKENKAETAETADREQKAA